MDRVVHLEDWAPESTASQYTPEFTAHKSEASSSSEIVKRRQRSLPFAEFAPVTELQDLTLEDRDQPTVWKQQGGIRGLFRKASVSLKSKTQRRHSHATEERPWTASPWHRLRQAASFSRHSKFLPATFNSDGPVDSAEELLAPVPGNGLAPPIIPLGSGGAAARATAAAQNEYFGRHRQLFLAEDQQNDGESGIGIAVTTVAEPVQYQDTSISRVDFTTILPFELCIQILSHLDHHALINALKVSKNWAKVASSQHIWREAFLREKSKTFAMSKPVEPGTGLGLPPLRADFDWKDLYRIRQQLEQNWMDGKAEPVYLNGHLDSIYCVQFDESKIITGSRDKTIRIWDMKTYACRLVIGPPDVVHDDILITAADGCPQHHAILPDSTRGAECVPAVAAFPIYHNASILCLQYDQNNLVTGSSDSTCIIYDIKQGYVPVRRLRHHTAAVLDLAFDERYIVTCSKDISICVWDRNTGNLVKQLRGHTGPVNAVQMRGNTIVSCSGDFRVKLWNIDTGKNIREFAGHTKGLACSQFSDDSRYIASAGNDKIIRIWDANTGECLKKIVAHENLVRSLHIDSISGRLISGSYDQDIKVFEMETGNLLLDFPKWHASWVLGAKSDYRRIISTGQDPKILIMDFGMDIKGIEMLESVCPINKQLQVNGGTGTS